MVDLFSSLNLLLKHLITFKTKHTNIFALYGSVKLSSGTAAVLSRFLTHPGLPTVLRQPVVGTVTALLSLQG